MLKWKDFSIGGYNFNDWGLVKELYVPEDINSTTDKSLHLRGREGLEHHLRHYVIPYNKVFIAFAVGNVKMSTADGIGLFGTGKSYGRYPVSHQQPEETNPGAPIAWSDTEYHHYGDPTPRWYYANQPIYGTLVLHNNKVYECLQSHWPADSPEPGTPGADLHWDPGLDSKEWSVDWESGKFYFFNELELVDVGGVVGAYMSMEDHTSSSDNKPCDNNWDAKWNPGDEFTADLSSQFDFSEECLRVSTGTKNPFSSDIIAVFKRHTENRLRRIDAYTTGGTMKAGATLYGIEVDA